MAICKINIFFILFSANFLWLYIGLVGKNPIYRKFRRPPSSQGELPDKYSSAAAMIVYYRPLIIPFEARCVPASST